MKSRTFLGRKNILSACTRHIGIATVGIIASIILLGSLASPAHGEPSIKPEQIPEYLADKGKTLSALKAVMSVNSVYDSGKSRQDIKGFLIYRRPSDFRFQGLAPGGNSLFELVIKAQNFELYVPTDNKIFKGGKDCFSRKFPDVAEIEGIVPLLLRQWKDVRFDRLLSRDPEKTVIRCTFHGRIWTATLEPQTLNLKRLVRLNPDGQADLTADFGDFKSGDDGWLPRRFEVQSPKGAWKTVVIISDIKANPFLIEKNFQLEPMFTPAIEQCR
jgi:outer membrane lipoprotein-sorting protein